MQSPPPTLVILAAGMASRYGSMKQIQAFGPSGETIIDYSIYDAIQAGFKKIVFIIRKEFAEDFRSIFNPKLKSKADVSYVFQEIDAYTNGYTLPANRTKPWGTAHAVLCAKEVVQEPFAVINADDFYGRDAFEKAYHFLTADCTEKTYAIIGYHLNKTLSEHGTVNRGVCQVNEVGNLVSVTERINIAMKQNEMVAEDNLLPTTLPIDAPVSMNFWCFHPSIFNICQQLFENFIAENADNSKAEFFIPIVADKFVHQYHGSIKVIPTTAQWFGVTYKEDAPAVKQSLDLLIAKKEYPINLW
jgi:UTP-glucose-1-phosphate uridylyltransferase